MTPTTHGEGLTQKAFEHKASRILVLLEIKATLRISGCVGHLGWRMFPEAVTWKIIHHKGQKKKRRVNSFLLIWRMKTSSSASMGPLLGS